jgi:hypothetical protein
MDDKHPKLPERVLCKHWLHHQCLNTLLTTPPFRKQCKECQSLLAHPKWEMDLKKIEKSWALKQAKERELQEAVDLLGLQDFAL